jgi:hypothetical protein
MHAVNYQLTINAAGLLLIAGCPIIMTRNPFVSLPPMEDDIAVANKANPAAL